MPNTSADLVGRAGPLLDTLQNAPGYTRYEEWLAETAREFRRLIGAERVMLHAPAPLPGPEPLARVLVGGSDHGEILPLSELTNVDDFNEGMEGRDRMRQFGLTAFTLEMLIAGDYERYHRSSDYQRVFGPNHVHSVIGIMLDGRRFPELGERRFAALTALDSRPNREEWGEETRRFLDVLAVRPLLHAMRAVLEVLPAAQAVVKHHQAVGMPSALWHPRRGVFDVNDSWLEVRRTDPVFDTHVVPLAVAAARDVMRHRRARGSKTGSSALERASLGVATSGYRYRAAACLAPTALAGGLVGEIVVVSLRREPLAAGTRHAAGESTGTIPGDRPSGASAHETGAHRPRDGEDVVLARLRAVHKLTPRMLAVMQLRADGMRRKEIAAALDLSSSTVKSYLDDIRACLGSSHIAFLDRMLRGEVPVPPAEDRRAHV